MQVHWTCNFKYYSIGAHTQLIKRIRTYMWFFNVHPWCINIILILVFQIKHNQEVTYIHKEFLNNISHLIKNRFCVKCLHYGFLLYNDNVLILKIDIIYHINGYMIPVYCFQKNQYLIYFTTDEIIYTFELSGKNYIHLSNWNHENIVASNDRWILVWRKHILLKFLWFVAAVVVSI